MNEKELLPCPFCGGEAAFGTVRYSDDHVKEQGWKQDTFRFVSCIMCGGNNRSIVGFKTQSEAQSHWNTRV